MDFEDSVPPWTPTDKLLGYRTGSGERGERSEDVKKDGKIFTR